MDNETEKTEAQGWESKWEQHRRDLYFALRSRVLTDAEMAEVASLDYNLVIEANTPYYEQDKRREFSDALLQQFKMQALARTAAAPSSSAATGLPANDAPLLDSQLHARSVGEQETP